MVSVRGHYRGNPEWNQLLQKRDTYPRGSDKWRELNRASLFLQLSSQINRQIRNQPFSRQDYVVDRVGWWLTNYEHNQTETWLKLDIRRVRDDILSAYGR